LDLIGIISFIPIRQQHNSRKQQQANSRQAPEAINGNQIPGSRRKNDVKMTSKRRTNDI